MKTHILVGGARIALPPKLPRIAESTPPSKRGILYRLKYQPKLVEEDAERFYYTLCSIQPQPKSIIELFGGVGINAQILQFMFNPLSHTVYPENRSCYEHLWKAGRSFNWTTSILEPLGGAGDVVLEEVKERHQLDLLVADFPNWTMARSRKEYQQITQTIFSKPAWVILTDSSRMQAPELEACVLGMGYRLVSGRRGKNNAYLLFKKA